LKFRQVWDYPATHLFGFRYWDFGFSFEAVSMVNTVSQ
jgi:hypothetical protein